MDWMDEAVRRVAPRALGAEPATARQAEAVARAVVAAETRERARVSRFRKFVGGIGLGVGLLGLGVTAATAGPAMFDWVGWSPDIVAQRSFDLGDGSEASLCEVIIRVEPQYGNVSVEEADRRTEDARKFLTEKDWEPLISSISGSEIRTQFAVEVARRAEPTPDGSMPPPATMSGVATQLMYDRISTEFGLAGHLQQGVSLEAAAGPCGDTTEGPTQ